MPCVYAHYRLGQEVLRSLPRDIRDTVMTYKELYDLGLHGPDILFYHSPVMPDAVTKKGRSLHRVTGERFFSDAGKVLGAHLDPAMYRAYVYGMLCHFALDAMSHGYVNWFTKARGVSHNEIEMEFDRALTTEDGHDPLHYDTAAHIVPSRRNAAVIAAFYPEIPARDIQRSLRRMILCLHTLLAPDKRTRAALMGAFRVTGRHYKQLSGLVMSLEPNPKCEESSKRLLELYKLAVPLAIKLISEYDRVREGKLEPDRYLKMNFYSEKVE